MEVYQWGLVVVTFITRYKLYPCFRNGKSNVHNIICMWIKIKMWISQNKNLLYSISFNAILHNSKRIYYDYFNTRIKAVFLVRIYGEKIINDNTSFPASFIIQSRICIVRCGAYIYLYNYVYIWFHKIHLAKARYIYLYARIYLSGYRVYYNPHPYSSLLYFQM